MLAWKAGLEYLPALPQNLAQVNSRTSMSSAEIATSAAGELVGSAPAGAARLLAYLCACSKVAKMRPSGACRRQESTSSVPAHKSVHVHVQLQVRCRLPGWELYTPCSCVESG